MSKLLIQNVNLERTPIFRILHMDNLELILKSGGMHASNYLPNDINSNYKSIHDADIQKRRKKTGIPCEPKGVISDYVPFYFGPRSPMLLKLKSGQVENYSKMSI